MTWTPATFVNALRVLGGDIRLVNGRVRVEAPAGVLGWRDREDLRVLRDGIAEHLGHEAEHAKERTR